MLAAQGWRVPPTTTIRACGKTRNSSRPQESRCVGWLPQLCCGNTLLHSGVVAKAKSKAMNPAPDGYTNEELADMCAAEEEHRQGVVFPDTSPVPPAQVRSQHMQQARLQCVEEETA